MLWGRRLFGAEILVALLFQLLWLGLLSRLTASRPQLPPLYGIGFLLPGIMAHDMGRQGVRPTLGAALVCLLAVFGVITLIGGLRALLGWPATRPEALAGTYAYPLAWLPLGVLASVLTSVLLAHRSALRTGGFVTAAYLALFAGRPLDLVFVGVCSAVTYLIVTRGLMPRIILFGRAKMSAMLLTGVLVTWGGELLLSSSGPGLLPWRGFNVIAPMIVALLANDAQRQGPPRTLAGAGLATTAVWAAMRLAGAGVLLFR